MTKLLLVIVLLLTERTVGYDSSVNNLKIFLLDYCEESELKNEVVIFKKDIKNVGFYAIAKVSYGNKEELVFAYQHIRNGENITTDKNMGGFNQVGSVFYSDNYDFFSSEDDYFGHGENYYLSVINDKISSASYNQKPIKVNNIL